MLDVPATRNQSNLDGSFRADGRERTQADILERKLRVAQLSSGMPDEALFKGVAFAMPVNWFHYIACRVPGAIKCGAAARV